MSDMRKSRSRQSLNKERAKSPRGRGRHHQSKSPGREMQSPKAAVTVDPKVLQGRLDFNDDKAISAFLLAVESVIPQTGAIDPKVLEPLVIFSGSGNYPRPRIFPISVRRARAAAAYLRHQRD